jgi:hypothetical protein
MELLLQYIICYSSAFFIGMGCGVAVAYALVERVKHD